MRIRPILKQTLACLLVVLLSVATFFAAPTMADTIDSVVSVVDIDARVNSQENPVVIPLAAGTYKVHVLREGGKFAAWNTIDKTLKCDADGKNCENGWETRYYLKSPYQKVVDATCSKKKFGSCRYATAAQASANAPKDVTLTLAKDTKLKFYIYDTKLSNNQGGLSLQITKSIIVKPPEKPKTLVYWTDWTSGTPGVSGVATGVLNIGSSKIDVNYTGQIAFLQSDSGTNFWTQGTPAPYTSAQVENAPSTSDIIAMSAAGTRTLTFSQPIDNLLFPVVSMNGNVYQFDRDFEILSSGQGYWGTGTLTKTNPSPGVYQLNGTGGEPHGMIRFLGGTSSITWKSLVNENWNGFTVGTYGVADPSSVKPPEKPKTLVYWTDWTSGTPGVSGVATGVLNIGSSKIDVNYTGQIAFLQSDSGTNFWTQGTPAPYTSAQVENAPSTSDIIAMSAAGTRTLTFSQPIDNLLFPVVSMNGNVYQFDRDFEILSSGQGYWGTGTLTKTNPSPGVYQLNGTGGEPHGMIRFLGGTSSITWKSLVNENWNGFTVGTYGVKKG
jgi:hypothetical protein